MKLSGFASVVAFVNEFLEHECFQFGFKYKGEFIKCVIGRDAIDAKLKWERPINADPSSKVWTALYIAALVAMNKRTYHLCLAYPGSLEESFRAADIPRDSIDIVLPAGEKNKGERRIKLRVSELELFSEAQAHAITYRSKLKKNCMVFSLGFGTIEMGVTADDGKIIAGTLNSIQYGLHHAAKIFRAKLKRIGYENPHIRDRDQDFLFDEYLQRTIDENEGIDTGRPTLNLAIDGKALTAADLKEVALESLAEYGAELVKRISDYIKNLSLDTQVSVVLTGGGTNYQILVDMIKSELSNYNYSALVADKKTSRESGAMGLSLIALVFFGDGEGIDIGNNNTIFPATEELAKNENELDQLYIKPNLMMQEVQLEH